MEWAEGGAEGCACIGSQGGSSLKNNSLFIRHRQSFVVDDTVFGCDTFWCLVRQVCSLVYLGLKSGNGSHKVLEGSAGVPGPASGWDRGNRRKDFSTEKPHLGTVSEQRSSEVEWMK